MRYEKHEYNLTTYFASTMGGLCSKSSVRPNKFSHQSDPVDYYTVRPTVYQKNNLKSTSANEAKQSTVSNFTPEQVKKSIGRETQERNQLNEPTSFRERGTRRDESNEDEFYDGIPRLPSDLSEKHTTIRAKQTAVAKVSRFGKAGSVGLEKAVEVLDTLGSSVTSLNTSRRFVSATTTKGNELHILAFEVANTAVKGSSLVQSLSKWSVRQLTEVVFVSEGVQNLVSKDLNELLNIVATDKREELKIFSGEVVRFGNRCKDSQWHNLDLYFEKRSKEVAPHKLSQEEAEQMIQPLVNMAQCTADLYHESHALDQLEQDYQNKLLDEDNPYSTLKGNHLAALKAGLKNQRKRVKDLKKKSLWCRSLEEIMERFVDIVLFLNREIDSVFGNADGDEPSEASRGVQQRLGPAGLALHYANMVIHIDNIVARCNSVPSLLRDTLYQSLPPSIKKPLRMKFQSFRVKEGLSVTEIKDEMEKTLHWLVPVAINTAKALHGFGWVGEWASTRTEGSRKSNVTNDVIRIETFHYADKEKTEACILELLLWLNHLVNISKAVATADAQESSVKPSVTQLSEKVNSIEDQGLLNEGTNKSVKSSVTLLSEKVSRIEDQEMLSRIEDQEILIETTNEKVDDTKNFNAM